MSEEQHDPIDWDNPPKPEPTRQLMYLSGCVRSLWFNSQDHCRAAVLRLMVCHPHHLAVTGEGCVLSCSELAVKCLEDSGLIDRYVLVEDGRGWE